MNKKEFLAYTRSGTAIATRLLAVFAVTAGTMTAAVSTKIDLDFSALNPIPQSHASAGRYVIISSEFRKPTEFRARASWLLVESRGHAANKDHITVMGAFVPR